MAERRFEIIMNRAGHMDIIDPSAVRRLSELVDYGKRLTMIWIEGADPVITPEPIGAVLHKLGITATS